MSAFDFARTRRPLLVALVVFLLAGVAATTMIRQGEQHKRQEQRLRVANLAGNLGHSAGDELLQAVATRIQHQVRESDTVARVGGDEFTVILFNITRRDEVQTVAQKIIAAVAAPFHLGSHSVEIGVSIGIAIYPADGQNADALIKAADSVMYGAKQVGGSFRFGAPDS